jgi:hypothetical protein
MLISSVNDTGDKLLTPLTKFISGVVDTSHYLCHGFFLFGGVVDTGDKFITGVFETAEK